MFEVAAAFLLALQAPAVFVMPRDDVRESAREWGRCVGHHAATTMLENRDQPLDPVLDASFARCAAEQARVREAWVRVEGEEAVAAQFPTMLSMARERAAATVREALARLER